MFCSPVLRPFPNFGPMLFSSLITINIVSKLAQRLISPVHLAHMNAGVISLPSCNFLCHDSILAIVILLGDEISFVRWRPIMVKTASD